MQKSLLYNYQLKGKPYLPPEIYILDEDDYDSLLVISGEGQDPETGSEGEGENPEFSKVLPYIFGDDKN